MGPGRKRLTVRPRGKLAELLAERTFLLARLAAVEGELNIAPKWKVGETVKVGDRRSHAGKIYQCIQGHTVHDPAWTPPASPALWMLAT